jgi:hypothetical protein
VKIKTLISCSITFFPNIARANSDHNNKNEMGETWKLRHEFQSDAEAEAEVTTGEKEV